MNEPTHNHQSQPGQHVLDLLNGSLDGDLNATQQAELDALLAGSASVRDLKEELEALSDILDRVPGREPPEYLHNAIVRQVRLPNVTREQQKNTGLISQWLLAPWMRTGLALAAGVLLTVGIYQTGSETLSPEDAARLTGTVVKNPQAELLDSSHFILNTFQGKAELRSKDGLLSVDLYIESEDLAVVSLGFANQGLQYAGINGLKGSSDNVSISDNQIRITSSGQQHYELLLKHTADYEAESASTLDLAVFVENVLVHEAELSSSGRK